MIQANDGGANVSLDGGRTWSTQANQPTAEIYQVAVDNQYPYRVYGAQQDNTTVIVPSLPLGNGQDFRVGPGLRDRARSSRTSTNPDIVYGGCKGQFSRLNMNTTNEAAVLGRRAIAVRQRRRRTDLPLPARVADGGLAARSARRLLRLAVSASHARWRRDLGEDQSRSDGASAQERRAPAASRSRATPPAKRSTARSIRSANRRCRRA